MNMSVNPPNILFVQADQLAASFLGCYGHSVVQSPRIDQLAANSVVFDKAYSNFPLCAPSRFSMLSGQLASAIGAYDNGAEFPSSIPTFVHYLRAMDYQTCLVGKMHFVGADQLHGFEERLTTDIYPSDFGWTGDWTEVAMGQSNDDSTFTGAGICKRNVQMEYDEEVVHRACRKMYDLARGHDERPFMMTVSMTHPHDPYQCQQQHWDRYRHEDIDMPTVAMLPEHEMDPYSKRLKAQYGLYQTQPDDETIRIARHAYYGSISYLDDQVGRLLDTLEDTGLAERTIVIFTSDHGDMLGERGLWYKKCFYENSIRIPLFIKIPAMPAVRVDKNVSLVDLLPTMLELAQPGSVNDVVVDEIQGRSLVTIMNGDTSGWPDTVYSEALAEGANAAVLMVKQGNLKYTRSGIDPEQLFDLDTDPNELTNLVGDSRYEAEHERLAGLASETWNVDTLSSQVRQNQRQRMFVAKALNSGTKTSWDYVAPDPTENHCLRPGKTYNQWAYDDPLGLKRPD